MDASTSLNIINNKQRYQQLRSCLVLILFIFISVFAVSAAAGISAKSSLLDIPLEQLGQIEITTASKVPEPLRKTAATVNVITAEDLRRMGARTIYDALTRVPGINVGHGQFAGNFIAIRGVRTLSSEKVLLLIDGHLLNDVRSGSATYQFLDSLPVNNIARIEVVRGPGSALYGANAFLGVINIITKRPVEINDIEVSGTDEFESSSTVARRYNLLAGGTLSKRWEGTTNINLLEGPGPDLPVKSDAFGRSGKADYHINRLDAQVKLTNGPFILSGRYLKRKSGVGFGVLDVLNNESFQQVEYEYLDAEYRAHPTSHADLTLRTYVDHNQTNNYFVLPAGIIPSTSAFFPWNSTGLIGNPLAQETISGAEARFDYRGMPTHILTTGLAWRQEKLYDVHFVANYDPFPLPQVKDVSDHFNWIDPATRYIASIYMQDLWDIHQTLRATLGARYDHFSDFGSTFNPRAGLTWQFRSKMSARLTYGKAFRAPSYVEQHSKLVLHGNPDLTPEKITTWEAGVNWQPGNLQADITLFRSNMNHLIETPAGSTQYQNLGEATVHGVELEVKYQIRSGLDVAANYTLANPKYTIPEPSLLTPKDQLNLMADTSLPSGIHWNIHGKWQSKTPRTSGDSRPPINGFWLVDTAVTMKRGRWDFSAAVYNLTDKDYATPSSPGTIPGDFTAPGRSFVIGIGYGL